MEFVNQCLLPDKKNPDWRKGVPHSWIRQEWHTALIIIHRKPWTWLIQSLNPNPQPNKQRKGKGKKAVTQKKSITVNEFSIKEEVSATKVTRTSKAARYQIYKICRT
jgi:hypothetical protein